MNALCVIGFGGGRGRRAELECSSTTAIIIANFKWESAAVRKVEAGEEGGGGKGRVVKS